MNTTPFMGLRVDVNAIELVRIIVGRLDEDVPPAVYRSISVDAPDYRTSLTVLGLRHATDGGDFTIADLDRSADHAIRGSVRTAGLVGGAGGLVGWVGVPPETAARVIQSARLAQRLAIIYGHDPSSDRGQAHIRKALAEAWGIALPGQMESDLRLSDLPTLIRRRPRAAINGPAFMVSTLTTAAFSSTTKRATRLVPGLGAALGVLSARRVAASQATAMKAVLRTPHLQQSRLPMDDAVVIAD